MTHILVFSYYYSSNTIQIAKGEKNVFYSNLFSLLKFIIIFFVRQRFLGVYTIFWKSTLPYSCFSFEVNNNFYRKWYINETTDYWAFLWYENHIFSFCYQKRLISFNSFWDTLEWEWINLGDFDSTVTKFTFP